MVSVDADVREVLRACGWHPERKVDIAQWVTPLVEEGYRLNALAERVLASFGGLVVSPVNSVGPNFSNDEPLNFDPIAAGSGHHELALEVESVLGGSYFPVGEWLSFSSVFLESGGRMIAAGGGVDVGTRCQL